MDDHNVINKSQRSKYKSSNNWKVNSYLERNDKLENNNQQIQLNLPEINAIKK